MIELRPYQNEALEAIENYEKEGLHRQLISLPTGCHRVGQGILMYDGEITAVESIQVDDLLMGPDSKPRIVIALARGQEDMVEVRPVKGGGVSYRRFCNYRRRFI